MDSSPPVSPTTTARPSGELWQARSCDRLARAAPRDAPDHRNRPQHGGAHRSQGARPGAGGPAARRRDRPAAGDGLGAVFRRRRRARCAATALRVASLGLNDLACWIVSGDSWYEITHASDFIRQPGSLAPQVRRHLKVVTDERGTCRRRDGTGQCLEGDYIFSLDEQRYPPVANAPRATDVVVPAGHVEIVGETWVTPTSSSPYSSARASSTPRRRKGNRRSWNCWRGSTDDERGRMDSGPFFLPVHSPPDCESAASVARMSFSARTPRRRRTFPPHRHVKSCETAPENCAAFSP